MTTPIYVADTHALVWHLFNPKRLGPTALQAFKDVENGKASLTIPLVVIAETAMVIEKGRITATLTQFEKLLDTMQHSHNYHVGTLTIETVQIAIKYKQISGIFDRLIVAETQLLNAYLITRDEEIQNASIVPIVW